METPPLLTWVEEDPASPELFERLRALGPARSQRERGPWFHSAFGSVGSTCAQPPDRPALYATTRKFLDDLGLRSLQELPPLCEREGLPVSVVGSLTGTLFSELRDKLADGLIQSERSYRGTLLGTRHGIDVGIDGQVRPFMGLEHFGNQLPDPPVADDDDRR